MANPLFGNQQESNLRSCEQMIESVLTARGLEPEACRMESDAGPAWSFAQGSANIYVFLSASMSGENFIQIVSPVMTPPAELLEQPQLLRRLLELNASVMTGASFGLRGEEVVLTTDRATGGLDRVEVEEMVRRVAEYADHYDDALTSEFGGARHSDQ